MNKVIIIGTGPAGLTASEPCSGRSCFGRKRGDWSEGYE
jgi:hypothetical protein